MLLPWVSEDALCKEIEARLGVVGPATTPVSAVAVAVAVAVGVAVAAGAGAAAVPDAPRPSKAARVEEPENGELPPLNVPIFPGGIPLECPPK